MKKLLVCLCLLSFQLSAKEALFNCNQTASRLSTKLQVIDISSAQGENSVMVTKTNDFGTSYLFGEKHETSGSPLGLNTLETFSLSDLAGNSFELEVSTIYIHSRACSPRAGLCQTKYITASLEGENSNESYSCL